MTKLKACEITAAALTMLSFAPATFAGTLAIPAVHVDPLNARYDPVLQMQVLFDGTAAYAAGSDTTIAYSQFQRMTGTPKNRDTEWYSAPDGFKTDE